MRLAKFIGVFLGVIILVGCSLEGNDRSGTERYDLKKVIVKETTTDQNNDSEAASTDDEEIEEKVREIKKEISEELESKREEVELLSGYMINNKYVNKVLGFSIRLPRNWVVQEDEALEQIMEQGKEILAGDDENLKASLDASAEVNILFNIVASKYLMGTPGKLNPAINICGENLIHLPGIRNAEDYLDIIKLQLENSQLDVELNDISDFHLDGVHFDGFESIMMISDIKIYQEMYASVINRYAVVIAITYFNEESKSELIEILSTFRRIH